MFFENRIHLLRISIGVIYLWFGCLKFFNYDGLIEKLALDTIVQLSFGYVPETICNILLGTLEATLGLLLLSNQMIRIAIPIALLHMFGTFAPLILQPEVCFQNPPLGFTLAGQYITKNIVIVCGLLLLHPPIKWVNSPN